MANKNPLEQLLDYGQSVWYDNIARGLIKGGQIQNLIDNFGVRGVTSNPTIFEKAISAGSDYDDQIKTLVNEGKNAEEVFNALAVEDIRNTADLFRPVYDSSNGKDGYVSIEVSPTLAHDTEGTLKDARNFFSILDRPNIMIKVPATPEGIPAITTLIGEGINVNVTLIFSLDAYEDVANAYIAGLEKLAASGKKPLDKVSSVASFFVSRVDTLVDKMLDEKIAATNDAAEKEKLENLKGKAAIANSKLAYERFERIFSTERFKKLEQQGAHRQRMLWASTSTKNPKYRDVLYVEELIGPETVDTMPPQTVDAFADHGQVARTIDKDVDKSHKEIDALEAAGISMEKVTAQLLAEGVKSFADSFSKMLEGVEGKRQKIQKELEVTR
ncbi:MAG TPA: transaldolase [Chloroflexia bacterium]|nr:transaldolase [Chloroflexia bacterium]